MEEASKDLTEATHECRRHFEEFGGRSGFFAYCLLASIPARSRSRLAKAKRSLLNWYFEKRRLDMSQLLGGIVFAGWPFEWFAQNFDAIAASMVAALVYGGGTRVVADFVIPAFKRALGKMGDSHTKLPEPLCRDAKGRVTVTDHLTGSGLREQFLSIVDLSETETDMVAADWVEASQRVIGAMSRSARSMLPLLLDGPATLGTRRPMGLDDLEARDLACTVEMAPADVSLVLYPFLRQEIRRRKRRAAHVQRHARGGRTGTRQSPCRADARAASPLPSAQAVSRCP